MNATVISAGVIGGFVLGMIALLIFIHRTGRRVLPVRGLWGLLIGGYAVVGAHFVFGLDVVGWFEGVVGFAALCAVLPVAYLIRRMCPECRRRLRRTEEVVTRPSRSCPGVAATTWSCPQCGHHRVLSHAIPRLAETSEEAGPWSVDTDGDVQGCFGAEHGAGAGGGAAWGEPQ